MAYNNYNALYIEMHDLSKRCVKHENIFDHILYHPTAKVQNLCETKQNHNYFLTEQFEKHHFEDF